MRTGEFLRSLRVLNPVLKVCSFGGNKHLAGLYYIDKKGEYFDICGVDKNELPEYSEYDTEGHMLVSGWRRVYLILLKLELTTREKIRKVCPGFFYHWSQGRVDADRKFAIIGDKVAAKIQQYSSDTGTLSAEQALDVAADIQRKDPEHVKEQAEKERWFLQTWAKRGGNTTDKPTI